MNKTNQLPPGPELDRLVAEAILAPEVLERIRAFKAEVKKLEEAAERVRKENPGAFNVPEANLGIMYARNIDNVIQPYSTSWAAAGEVLEWLSVKKLYYSLSNDPPHTIWLEDKYKSASWINLSASTTPHAICLALLKAKEEGLL